MSAFNFKVAYTTDENQIQPAIDSGVIDKGDLIIINTDGIGSMKFITNENELISLNATITEAEKQSIKDEVIEETDNRYLPVDNSGGTIILDGNSSVPSSAAISASTRDEFFNAIANDSTTAIALTGDITVNTHAVVTERDLTIDLGSHIIENTTPMWSDDIWSIFRVENATLTLDGNGTAASMPGDCYVIDIEDNGTVIINGGTYNGNISSIYLHGENSTCYIKGGYFKIQQLNSNGVEGPYGLMINIYNKVRNSAKCIITGGTFEGYNPAEPEENDITYLPEGYTTHYNPTNNTYTVVKEA